MESARSIWCKKKREVLIIREFMKKAYIYPISGRDNTGVHNPYVDNFVKSFGKYFEFVNVEHPSYSGILDIRKYVGKIDYIFFHWIENIVDRKGGYFQMMFLISLFYYFKLKGIKTVWTVHNKISHEGTNYKLKRRLVKFLLRNCDYLIVHAKEGVEFAKKFSGKDDLKIIFRHHPVAKDLILSKEEKIIDILIWGRISPYKGIDTFLELLYDKQMEDRFKILIIGKVSDESYGEKLMKFQNAGIKIINRFAEDEELNHLAMSSRIILFPYQSSSVLGSGVLMDSIVYEDDILGPEKGAFADLANEKLIYSYNDYDEMIDRIDGILKAGKNIDTVKRKKFIDENSWENYAGFIMDSIESFKK